MPLQLKKSTMILLLMPGSQLVIWKRRKGVVQTLRKEFWLMTERLTWLQTMPNTYNNRGATLALLGRIAEARADFEQVREIAKKAGSEKLVSAMERNLHKLENA